MIYNPTIETMPLEELRRLQDERLRRMVHYLHERVPFYRARFAEMGLQPGDVRGIHDLTRLPITRKTDLRDNYPFGLFAVPRNQLSRIHGSSGTTGKPTVVGYTRNDLETFSEVVARSLAAAGAEPGMTIQNAYGYGLFTGGLGLHYGAEKLGLTVVPISGGMTERQVMLIEDFRPEIIACTPSYAQTLAEEFHRRGIAPEEISLKIAVLGAEPWTEAIRGHVEGGLGVRALNIYGLSEIIGPGVSQEAYEEQNGLFVWEDHFYPEVVDPATGEPLPDGEVGVLLFTTLTKEALPLLRYWTGDLTYLFRTPSVTGRTHIRMGPIQGRTDDMLIVRGVNLYPTQIEAVLTGMAQVVPNYRIILTRESYLDEVELQVELAEDLYREVGRELLAEDLVEADGTLRDVRDLLRGRLKEAIGLTMKITLLAPGTGPKSEGGKLSRTIDRRSL